MILKILKKIITDQTIDTISQKLGTDASTIKKGIDFIFPMILGGLSKNTESAEGAQSLLDALNKDHDGSISDEFKSNFVEQKGQEDGGKILSHIFKGQKTTVIKGVAEESGLDESTSNGLMSMLAPVVMGQLGKANKEQQFDLSSLSALLKKEGKETKSKIGEMAKKFIDANNDGSIEDDLLEKGKDLLKELLD